MTVVVHGYRYSVYQRIVRMALAEKSIDYDQVEVDPFVDVIPADYLRLHPFGRVPTLVHDDFVLYETRAIVQYIAEAFDGPPLRPADVRARARMAQIMSIVDSYAYWPMVRQVFSQRVFGVREGRPADEEAVRTGLHASMRVLAALENIAAEGKQLRGDAVSLADIYLSPMLGYFCAAPEGRAAVAQHPFLSRWWAVISQRESFRATDPGLPGT